MALLDAVIAVGPLPPENAPKERKKRYSEVLSQALAQQVASGQRAAGFTGVRPLPGGPGERAFQGGLGPKKVDVSHADEQPGLKLAVSIKCITTRPYGKDLKNRFHDLCPEGITLHLRFPYAVVCALFCFPNMADEDTSPQRKVSTFQRARKLLATISGCLEYTDPGEKFENVTMVLFRPVMESGKVQRWVKLIDANTNQELSEADYFDMVRAIFNRRNPHASIGEETEEDSA